MSTNGNIQARSGKFIVLEGIPGSYIEPYADGIVDRIQDIEHAEIENLGYQPDRLNCFGSILQELWNGALPEPGTIDRLLIPEIKQLKSDFGNRLRTADAITEDAGEFCEILDRVATVLKEGELPSVFEEWCLMLADEYLHLGTSVIPALRRGAWVIQCHSDLTSLTFGTVYGLEFEKLYRMRQSVLLGRSEDPDLTVMIAVDPERALSNITAAGDMPSADLVRPGTDALGELMEYDQQMLNAIAHTIHAQEKAASERGDKTIRHFAVVDGMAKNATVLRRIIRMLNEYRILTKI